MTEWKRDKQWSDRFLPEIKRILGEHLIGEPPQEEDAERNTDLIVLRMEAVRIGCRVRRFQYLNYAHEFTIRSGRPSGTKTELTKIIEGWGDYFFYGFCDEPEQHLVCWVILDLKHFRLWYMRTLAGLNAGNTPGSGRNNRDGSSSFLVFRWGELPPKAIIAQQTKDS